MKQRFTGKEPTGFIKAVRDLLFPNVTDVTYISSSVLQMNRVENIFHLIRVWLSCVSYLLLDKTQTFPRRVRIAESLRLEKNSKIIEFNLWLIPPCQLHRNTKGQIQSFLEHLWDVSSLSQNIEETSLTWEYHNSKCSFAWIIFQTCYTLKENYVFV